MIVFGIYFDFIINTEKYLLELALGCLFVVTNVGVDEAKLNAIVFGICWLIFDISSTSDFLFKEPYVKKIREISKF